MDLITVSAVLAGVGWVLGGPLGGLIHDFLGDAYDRLTGDRPLPPPDQAVKSIAFTIGVIALSAKMAKADGAVTLPEITAFRRLFTVSPEEQENARRVFDLARRNTAGFETYARQIAALFPPASPVLEELLGSLAAIARADHEIHPDEVTYLQQVAAIFGFEGQAFRAVLQRHLGLDACCGDPDCTLGVEPSASDADIRRAYLALVRDHHPDRLIAGGLPAEAISLATETLAGINAAWETIKKERGLA